MWLPSSCTSSDEWTDGWDDGGGAVKQDTFDDRSASIIDERRVGLQGNGRVAENQWEVTGWTG